MRPLDDEGEYTIRSQRLPTYIVVLGPPDEPTAKTTEKEKKDKEAQGKLYDWGGEGKFTVTCRLLLLT
jgi:hypothetical protein